MSPTLIAWRRRGLVAVVAILSITTGCSGERRIDQPARVTDHRLAAGLHGTLVTNPPLARPTGVFRDTAGERFQIGSASRDVTALFFGFTKCDDVCPTTMADLAVARRSLPADVAQRVQVVFVTVDPARDTPRLLRRWLDRFDHAFVGLRASRQIVHRAERRLYAPLSGRARTEPSHEHDDTTASAGGHRHYQVNHTGSVYVFGPGDQSLIYTGGTPPDEYAEDFERLLAD